MMSNSDRVIQFFVLGVELVKVKEDQGGGTGHGKLQWIAKLGQRTDTDNLHIEVNEELGRTLATRIGERVYFTFAG